MKPKYFIINLLLTCIFLLSCRKDEIQRPEKLTCALENSQYKTNPKSAALQKIIDDYTKKGLPGVILLVKNDNGFYIGAAGKADIKKNIDMQACHVSKIASITKFMLGVATLRLQEKGTLHLDDPINKYISNDILSKIKNCEQPLTIRNLMKHTTGIYDVITDQGFYLQVLNNPSKHWTAEDLLEYVYEKPAYFPFSPADTASYSNTNFLLLSMIIEKASGKSHSKVLHDEIIDLLGMEDTYYFWHDDLPKDRIVQGYFDLYNNGNLENLSNWNTGSGNGYGGIYSTVWDMYLFADALFIKKTLLSQSSLDEMLVFHHTIETRKNLGVACYKDFIDIGSPIDFAWGHRGRDLCYSADLDYFPNHNTIMSLIVNYGTDGNSPLKEVFKEMRDEIAKEIIKP